MSLFNPKTFPEIMGSMIDRLISVTPLTDINYGSVWTTMLEAAAQEDDEQYFQMLEIIRGYSLDTTTGDDLDTRATEYGISRLEASEASTTVTISDSAVVKVYTGVYSGLSGSAAGSLEIRGDTLTGFPSSGSVIIGRGTPNAETVAYSSITDNGNYVVFNLTTALAFDHGTDETIVYSQGGNRLVAAGTVVSVPASDISAKIDFTIDSDATILDGETEVSGVAVTATEAGSSANVPIGSISIFDSLPFSTAMVKNHSRVTNGKDIETDQELRDRIKAHIQSLSRGTGKAIISGVIGLISDEENKRVISASLVEPTTPADVVKLYIDDGTGFIPSFSGAGYEEVVVSATGGEKFVKSDNTPMIKAFSETQNSAPWNLIGGETLFVEVGGEVETVTFQSVDFSNPGSATAQEVLKKINSVANLFEARVTSSSTKVKIFARKNFDEAIRVSGGTANSILNFPTDLKYTTKLYIERDNELMLLSKDGITSSIESGNAAAYDMSQTCNLSVIVDGKANQPQNIWFYPTDFLSPSNVLARQVKDIINQRLMGAVANTSSNDTKIKITSNIQRSASSRLRIVETFSLVFNEESSTLVNRTNEAKSTGTFPIFGSQYDYLYLGHFDVKFNSIYIKLDTLSSNDVGLVIEYYNGAMWTPIGVQDLTLGFTQDGNILFQAPNDWALTSVNSSIPAYWIRLQRTTGVFPTPPVGDTVKVCSANEIFNFSETEIIGANNDYSLNRFVGQIELASPLLSGDKLTLGSYDTKAFVLSTTGAFGLSGGEVLTVITDGISQTLTFAGGDFSIPGAATAQEVANVINANFSGALVSTVDAGTKVKVQSNRWSGGTIQVQATTANNFLQFPTSLVGSMVSHVPSVESITGPSFTFAIDQNIIVVMDDNLANNFTIPLYKAGAVVTATLTTVVDPNLTYCFFNNDEIVDFDIEMTSGTEIGLRRSVTGYNALTGEVTFNPALSNVPLIGDRFDILPTTAAQVVQLWNNKQISLISTKAEISTVMSDQRVQIASKSIGSAASVLVSGGTGNTVLQFSILRKEGVDGYKYYTGLAQKVQWTVDGKENDSNLEGIRAAGVQVETIDPVTIPIRVELAVITSEGFSVSSISNYVKSSVSSYINNIAVGGDVVISEIIMAVKNVTGISDVRVIVPSSNVAIADNELPRVTEADIVVG